MIFTKFPLKLRLQIYKNFDINNRRDFATICYFIYKKIIFFFNKIFEFSFRILNVFLNYINICILFKFNYFHDVMINYYEIAFTNI